MEDNVDSKCKTANYNIFFYQLIRPPIYLEYSGILCSFNHSFLKYGITGIFIISLVELCDEPSHASLNISIFDFNNGFLLFKIWFLK